jgi:hypothetical protein
MPLIRVVFASLLLCSSVAFGQDSQTVVANRSSQPKPNRIPGNVCWSADPLDCVVFPPAATAAEPWRILTATKSPSSLLLAESTAPLPALRNHKIFVMPNDGVLGDTTCFTIHSFVVARDRKDSDAVHLVRSSTCQPANQYAVKTIELRTNPSPAETQDDSLPKSRTP